VQVAWRRGRQEYPPAAFSRDKKADHQVLEQADIITRLNEQGTDNSDPIDRMVPSAKWAGRGKSEFPVEICGG
jgi:hypothetical protein